MLFNGVELRPLPQRRAARRPTGPTIFFCGRHEQRKGLDVLLAGDAPAAAPTCGCGWPATGPTPTGCRRSYAGDPRIEWLGPDHRRREDRAGCAGADVFCAPSLRGESFGVVLIEAMAAGTPIVASALDGYRNVATDGVDALLVAPGDADGAGRGAATGCSPTPALAARLRAAGAAPGRGLLDGPRWPRATPSIYEQVVASTGERPPTWRLRASLLASGGSRRMLTHDDRTHHRRHRDRRCSLVIVAVVAYNGLIRLRNQVENAWSQIDVQLKRRIDLIPNLVETVKGYAAHEKDTLDAVIQARNAAIAAPDTPAGQAEADNADHRRAAPAVRPLRGLPRPEGQPELPRPAGGADRHRGPRRLRAAVLQRHRAGLQQQDPDVPDGDLRPAC